MLPLPLSAFFLLMLTLCVSAQGEEEPYNWGTIKFSTVKAFRTNWEIMKSTESIWSWSDGEINEESSPLDGLLLSAEQVIKLRTATSGTHVGVPQAACFLPHHAFLFYDSEGKVVAVIDICFLCGQFSGRDLDPITENEFSAPVDLDSIEEIFESLSIPLTNPDWGPKAEK